MDERHVKSNPKVRPRRPERKVGRTPAKGDLWKRHWICTKRSARHAQPWPRSRRRAGVQRLTVYNNFPNEAQLFDACGQHSMERNPPPDPSTALAIDNPGDRLRAVLGQLYVWYRKNARASENLQRDRLVMPALDSVMRIRMDPSSRIYPAAPRLRVHARGRLCRRACEPPSRWLLTSGPGDDWRARGYQMTMPRP